MQPTNIWSEILKCLYSSLCQGGLTHIFVGQALHSAWFSYGAVYLCNSWKSLSSLRNYLCTILLKNSFYHFIFHSFLKVIISYLQFLCIAQALHSTTNKNHFTALAGKLSLYSCHTTRDTLVAESDSVLAKGTLCMQLKNRSLNFSAACPPLSSQSPSL